MDVFGGSYQVDPANIAAVIALGILGLAILAVMHWRRYFRYFRVARKLDKVKGIMLGKKYCFYAYLPADQEEHVIVFGRSGQGKTSAILIPTLRSLDGGFFAIDIAGDIYPNVDRPDKLLYDFNDPYTIPYNVFGLVDGLKTKKKKNEALCQIAEQVIRVDENTPPTSKFFLQAAQTLFKAALITFYWKGADFIDVCRIVANCNIASMIQLLEEEGNSDALPYYVDVSDVNPQTNGSVKQDLGMAIQLFAGNEMLQNSLRRPRKGEMCITPFRLEDHSIFVTVPEDKTDMYAPLIRLITDQCFTYLYNRPSRFKRRILLCLDEFTEFRGIDVEKALRLLRKRRVRLLLLTQSKANLDNVYGVVQRESMMNNLPLVCIMNMSSYEEQVYFSNLLGWHWVRRRDEEGNFRWVHEKRYEAEKLDQLENKVLLRHPYGVIEFKKANYWKETKRTPARGEREDIFCQEEPTVIPALCKNELVSCCVTVSCLGQEEQIQKKSVRLLTRTLSGQIREAAQLCEKMAREELWDSIEAVRATGGDAGLMVHAEVQWGTWAIRYDTQPIRMLKLHPYSPKKCEEVVDSLTGEIFENTWRQLVSLASWSSEEEWEEVSPRYQEGDRVDHDVFGLGTVLSVETEPWSEKVEVLFDTGETRVLESEIHGAKMHKAKQLP